MGSTTPTDPTDTDLVPAARGGDAGALGLLPVRHRPSLPAVAIGVLGYGPDAEDAVQDASVVALRRIGDLRDPEDSYHCPPGALWIVHLRAGRAERKRIVHPDRPNPVAVGTPAGIDADAPAYGPVLG
jgi:DNA-directed RNA polymerase specialized sigma24 family protein